MRARRSSERGVTAVVVAIGLVMLVSFLGLALNVGHLYSVRGELQNAADAGAISGTMELNGNAGPPITAALAMGEDLAERHFTDTSIAVSVAASDVDVGFWDKDARLFTRYDPDAVTAELASCAKLPCINAVRVNTSRDAAHAGTVDVAFGGILGKLTQDVGATAVAVSGGPCTVECADLPVALPDCGIASMLGPPCVGGTYVVKFQNDTTDTGAWTTLQTVNGGGASLIQCLLQESLATPDGKCKTNTACNLPNGSSGTELDVTDPIWVSNGTIKSACDLVAEMYAKHKNAEYLVPVVAASCPNQKWNQHVDITNWAVVKIASAPTDCTGTNKFFTVEIVCGAKTDHGKQGGCVANGVWLAHPQLVK
jgi:Flp pilus assembly protein TadG